MIRYIFSAVAMLLAVFSAPAQMSVRFHNEAADTAAISSLLIAAEDQRFADSGDAVVWFADQFVGKPYVAHTLESTDGEKVTVNVDELDCTTLVETVIALTLSVNERRTSWRDFVYNLERIRYRGGSVDGYPSRLHYISDWIVDNSHRGNFREATTLMPNYAYVVKTIDFMSANADKYPALADSLTLARIKNVETGYRSHRFPYVKTIDSSRKDIKGALHNGDILAFTSKIKNLDVTHLGIVVKKDGEPYVLHASSSAGKVVLSDMPLDRFMKRNPQFTGFRVVRLE